MSYQKDIIEVAKLSLPWELLDDCNILITGASGLIGSCLVEVLMARTCRKYNVFAMGRNVKRMEQIFKQYTSQNDFNIIQGDVTKQFVFEQPFHYIIHAASGAAPTDFVHNPVEVMKANFNGVINMIEYGLKHDMRRLLYISSGEVYGEGDGRIFSEEYSGFVDCTNPRSCYPSSKRAAENLCVSYAKEYGADVVIARPCHIYGPNFTEHDNRVYTQFIRNVLCNEDVVLKSSGQQFRSWCYVVDCVSALLYILLKGKCSEAYNVADEKSNISIKEMAEMIATISGRRVIINLPSDNKDNGYNLVQKSIFSTRKLEDLGWKINGQMMEKIKKTINRVKEINNEKFF